MKYVVWSSTHEENVKAQSKEWEDQNLNRLYMVSKHMCVFYPKFCYLKIFSKEM